MDLPVLRDTDGIFKLYFDSIKRRFVGPPAGPQPQIEETSYVSLKQIRNRFRTANLVLDDRSPKQEERVAKEVPEEIFNQRWQVLMSRSDPNLEANIINLMTVYVQTKQPSCLGLIKDKLIKLEVIDKTKAQEYYNIIKELEEKNEHTQTHIRKDSQPTQP